MDQSFEEVLEENKERILRICRIYARSPIEPQDLFQEVVYQTWKSFSSFKNKSEINTWVYRIALNVCQRSKMQLEKKILKLTELESIDFALIENPLYTGQEEKYQALHDCISLLNDADKPIVILYLDELSYKKIASILGLTENHIAVKMKRIKRKLFDCINKKTKC